jgi:DNA mismatch repair protein MutS
LMPKAALRKLAAGSDQQASEHPQLRSLLEAAREQGFGELELRAAATGLSYAQATQLDRALPIARIAPYDPSDQLQLDEAAVRNLELVATLSGERKGSLLHLLDETKTSMGARLLRRRLLAPLTDLAQVRRRHDRVQALLEDAPLRERLQRELAQVADLDRLASRAALGVATPRDLGALRASLGACESLFRMLAATAGAVGGDILAALAPDDTCADLQALLSAALQDELPLVATAGGIFREAHDARVAELRALADDGKGVLLQLEERERVASGITSLKVKYTKVFGYYMEISKSRLASVPAHFKRKQTVAGGERFTTDELEQLQAKILNADERLRGLEQELFVALRADIGGHSARLKRLGETIADLDVHATLAELAHRHDYVRPNMDDGRQLELIESRHPIVERVVQAGGFVPNDVALDPESARLMLITGPNMAGKSTVMRQVALCVLMAQAGSFVPAKRARIGLVDRIYTRVGASDNLAQGQSTFMVEMSETAAILRGATARSLVVLDEIGRGTSTYDGLAIAWAVAEHLHDAIGCRAMFATHYHELCDLPRTHPYAVNFNVAARQQGEKVVFLHRLTPGGANRSYGVAVAQLAGVPEIVLARARTLLKELERSGATAGRAPLEPSPQLDMFAITEARQDSEVEATLRALDPDRMPPVEALVALARLKGLLPPRE